MSSKPKSIWIRFGLEVRRTRMNAGLSQRQLAKAISVSPSLMSSIERGTRTPKKDHVDAIDQVLDTSGSMARMWSEMNKRDLFPSYFRKAVEFEMQATEIREYQPLLIPGLVQTPDYARALYTHGRPWDIDLDVEPMVESRMRRQQLLAKPGRPLVWMVLEEGVIRRVLDDPHLAHAQLGHLVELAVNRTIRLQVVPSGLKAHPGFPTPFRIFTFPDRPTVVSAEHVLDELVIDEPERIRWCGTIFGVLQSEALSPGASVDLIRQVQGELDE